MGQQQLLLIVLGLVVIAIAVVVGISLFRAHAISSKRDILTNETIDMAAQAISYYKRTSEFGGGGKSFIGWQYERASSYSCLFIHHPNHEHILFTTHNAITRMF